MEITDYLTIIRLIVNRNFYPNPYYEREDVFQDCVVYGIKLLERNKDDTTFPNFLAKHLKHHVRAILAKKPVLEIDDELAHVKSEEARYLDQEVEWVIDEYKKKLSAYHADILEHHIIEQDMRLTAIAAQHKKSKAGVYSIHSRVYNDFHDYLTERYDDY